VVVTDGFTGNVVLKTLEGSMRFAMRSVVSSFDLNDETKAAGAVLLPALLPFAEEMDPDTTGGAVLLGVRGVCVISHGSSSARAVVNAVRVAHAAVADGLVDLLAAAVA
jgi:glycerol-3-phosphate acyltransferase PlsX